MINATELRIGNWVMADDVKEPYQVSAHGILVIQNSPDNRSPIPITPEILEKCGFYTWGRDDYPRTVTYELKDEMHIFPANCFCDFEGYGFMHYKISNEINNENKGINESATFKFKYLHQLQNLYFALTNSELEITL